jgi:hypothetical protein
MRVSPFRFYRGTPSSLRLDSFACEAHGFILPEVFRRERSQFQIHGDQSPKPAVIKEQVEIKIRLADAHALLPRDEAEIAAEFEQELFHLAQDRPFQILLAESAGQIEEVKDVRIAKDHIG